MATMRRERVIRIGIAFAAGLGTWLITGWPVGGVVAGCAVFFLPSFFTVGRQMERRIQRLEALEEWVRTLADSMAVGSAPIATIVRSAARAGGNPPRGQRTSAAAEYRPSKVKLPIALGA